MEKNQLNSISSLFEVIQTAILKRSYEKRKSHFQQLLMLVGRIFEENCPNVSFSTSLFPFRIPFARAVLPQSRTLQNALPKEFLVQDLNRDSSNQKQQVFVCVRAFHFLVFCFLPFVSWDFLSAAGTRRWHTDFVPFPVGSFRRKSKDWKIRGVDCRFFFWTRFVDDWLPVKSAMEQYKILPFVLVEMLTADATKDPHRPGDVFFVVFKLN